MSRLVKFEIDDLTENEINHYCNSSINTLLGYLFSNSEPKFPEDFYTMVKKDLYHLYAMKYAGWPEQEKEFLNRVKISVGRKSKVDEVSND